jgi:hypothetical protein
MRDNGCAAYANVVEARQSVQSRKSRTGHQSGVQSGAYKMGAPPGRARPFLALPMARRSSFTCTPDGSELSGIENGVDDEESASDASFWHDMTPPRGITHSCESSRPDSGLDQPQPPRPPPGGQLAVSSPSAAPSPGPKRIQIPILRLVRFLTTPSPQQRPWQNTTTPTSSGARVLAAYTALGHSPRP